MQYIFILGRILMGGFFLNSGFNHLKNLKDTAGYAASKGIPMPKLAVFITGLMLILGGLGIIFLFHMALALMLIILFLIPTTIMMHQYWRATDPMQKMGEMINFYKNLGLLGAALMLFALFS
ncbi:MAG: DoxX family membrane protein [Candidatus Nomurabacteria bacterium]|nr:DoxX family membrane protein [Candidatus Nomurabacteria bacterium]